MDDSDSDEVERALEAIRGANGFDLTIPEHRTSLEEDALKVGATAEQVREAAAENENWPF